MLPKKGIMAGGSLVCFGESEASLRWIASWGVTCLSVWSSGWWGKTMVSHWAKKACDENSPSGERECYKRSLLSSAATFSRASEMLRPANSMLRSVLIGGVWQSSQENQRVRKARTSQGLQSKYAVGPESLWSCLRALYFCVLALVGHEEGSKGLSVQWVGQTPSRLVAVSRWAGPVQQWAGPGLWMATSLGSGGFWLPREQGWRTPSPCLQLVFIIKCWQCVPSSHVSGLCLCAGCWRRLLCCNVLH